MPRRPCQKQSSAEQWWWADDAHPTPTHLTRILTTRSLDRGGFEVGSPTFILYGLPGIRKSCRFWRPSTLAAVRFRIVTRCSRLWTETPRKIDKGSRRGSWSLETFCEVRTHWIGGNNAVSTWGKLQKQRRIWNVQGSVFQKCKNGHNAVRDSFHERLFHATWWNRRAQTINRWK